MSIKYTVVPNALRPGEYYTRPASLTTRRLEAIVDAVSRSTTISSSDVTAVIDVFIHEIVAGLLNGDRVSLDDFMDFRQRLSQVLRSAADGFDPQTGGQLLIASTVKPALTKRLRRDARFEKVKRVIRRPSPAAFEDARTKEKGVYSAGGSARIVGSDLQILDPQADDQGIFFIAADGAVTKVVTIQDNGDKKLTFEIPDHLTRVHKVEVRTRYAPAGRLRIGALEDEILPATAE